MMDHTCAGMVTQDRGSTGYTSEQNIGLGVSPDPVEGAAGKTLATEPPVTSQTATGLLVCELFFPPVYPTPKVFQHSVHECLCYSALVLLRQQDKVSLSLDCVMYELEVNRLAQALEKYSCIARVISLG